MKQFDAVDVIRVKRDGGKLSTEEIQWTIDAYTRGVMKDEQMAALAMAVFLRGMDREEIVTWTQAMIDSGERMDFARIGRVTADKHSTGGVGDKITLPLAPLVACFGVAVPQLSGRGLGHTGGTLDKLEAIPGWRASLSNEEIYHQLGEGCGAVICAAGAGLAPADKKLYALRDITSTVDCIPLIASSIMSKKIAEGTDSLVLDVKVGSGAFMKDIDNARELARTMVDLGRDAGVKTQALLTDMSTPLGLKVGNALEVEESVEVLAGGGPADVVELTVELARTEVLIVGVMIEIVRVGHMLAPRARIRGHSVRNNQLRQASVRTVSIHLLNDERFNDARLGGIVDLRPVNPVEAAIGRGRRCGSGIASRGSGLERRLLSGLEGRLSISQSCTKLSLARRIGGGNRGAACRCSSVAGKQRVIFRGNAAFRTGQRVAERIL